MSLSRAALEELKQINFEKTGEKLSEQEALDMGTRLINLFKVIGKKIPENSEESDE